MFTNKYPYTDFHELNLDWILEQTSDMNKRVSYLEDEFSKIIVLTKEQIQKMIDATAEETLGSANKYTDEKAELLTSNYERYVEAQIDIFKVYSDSEDTRVLAESKAYTDTTSINDRAYTDSKLINATFMINPITGMYEDTRDVITSIVSSFHRTNAINAIDYDNKHLTVGTYDALLLTAFNYDFNAKKLLP